MDEPSGIVTITAKDGRSDELLQLLEQMATEAAKDDGCEIYAVHRARSPSDTFFLYELYRDRDAFKQHQQNSKLRSLGAHLGELAESVVLTVGNLVGGDRATRS